VAGKVGDRFAAAAPGCQLPVGRQLDLTEVPVELQVEVQSLQTQ
jgi:hypothetical protein